MSAAISPAWARAGGWRLWVYSNSLLLSMGTIFLLSWLVQALAGRVERGDDCNPRGGRSAAGADDRGA